MCDGDMVNALTMLGKDKDLSAEVYSHLERFVCNLCKSEQATLVPLFI